jgi:RHS repeat-associated protein
VHLNSTGASFVAAWIVASLLGSLPSAPAFAANGQCRWEGGPGAPTYGTCELEDCLGNGGLAQCYDPDVYRPPLPFTESEAGSGKWMYYSCAETSTDNYYWCHAAGGSYSGTQCLGLSTAYPRGNPTIVNDETTGLATMSAYAAMKYGTCPTSLVSDSGWGTTMSAGLCAGNSTAPVYRNGKLITDHRRRIYQAGGLCHNSQLTVWYTRGRQLVCPVGYRTRNRPDGGLDCFIPAEACCTLKGNPVSIVTGAKLQLERDYAGGPGTAIEFVRHYNSAGFYRPDATTSTEERADDFWRHGYDRRLYPVAGNATLIAIAHRPDGTLRHFDGSGKEILNRDGAGMRLVTLPAGQGWTLTLADEQVERYDAAARLISIRQRGGREVSLSYDLGGRLGSVADESGHRIDLAYDIEGRLVQLTLPGGALIVYSYDAKRRLASIAYPDAAVRTYHYENSAFPWLLTGITDERAQRFATYTYNEVGQVMRSEHAGGAMRHDFAYGTYGTTVTYPLGFQGGFPTINKAGVQKLYSLPQGCPDCNDTQSLGYDVNGNIAGRTDNRWNRTSYAYDLARNLEILRTEGLNIYGNATAQTRTITTQWHPTFRAPTQIEVFSGATATGTPLRRETFTHDASGNVLTRTITDTSIAPNVSRSWTYTYDAFGRLLTEDGPRTDVSDLTTYTYYTCTTGFECGQLASVTNALNQTTTYNTYNAHGQPLTITDPNGVVTTLSYDARQRPTDRCVNGLLPSCAGGELTRLEYWPTGLLKKITPPDGSFLLYSYDAAHRLTRIEDGAGNRIEYTLDAAGNRTAERAYDPTNVLRRTHTRVFDALGQLWKDVNAAGTAAVTTVYGYDGNGNQTNTNAPLSRTTTSAYDELNRLKQITDPALGNTTFAYDALDNLTSLTDPRGKLTSYQYSGLGDLKQQVSPDTGTTTNTYDSAGNLATSTDARAKTATYGYDALNRVTSITWPDQALSFGYDAGPHGKGRLTSASDAQHSLAYTHDALGRLTGKGQTVGAVTLAVGYGYAQGRLSTLTLPSGQVVTYGYDSNGRITSVAVGGTTVLHSILHEPFGPIAGWTWGNGTLAARTHDADGQVTQVDSAGLKTYSYDDAFRLTGITDAQDPARSFTYGYDALDRLTSAARSGLTQSFSYDANGNRLSEGGSAPSTYTVSTTSNRLASISGALARTYSHDAVGNVTGYAGVTLSYNDRGRLGAASYGGNTASYTYDALGQRVRRTSSAGTTLYAYDEGGHLLGEYDGAGALLQETVWLGDIPIATLRPNGAGGVEIFYVHTDHLYTPRIVTRPSDNAERWRWDTEPFGSTAPNDNPAGLGAFVYNLRFPGQLYDGLAGLYYNYFRDYDPAIGRYVQSDPIGLNGGSFSTYAYVNGNPVSNVDPLGLASCDGKWVKWGELIPTLPGPGWTLSPGMCFCYWMCKPCRGGIAWSGNMYSLPNTRGIVLVDYSGRNPPNTGSAGIRPTPSGPARGQSGAAGGAYTCICKKPSEETKGPGCDKCYPDSNF